jgi:signal transduction histidine kinase
MMKTTPNPPSRSARLVVWMLLAIGLVTGLAWWDERREADASLADLGSEQAVQAASLAGSLRAHLATIERDAAFAGEHGTAALAPDYQPALVRAATDPPTARADPSRLVVAVHLTDGRVVDFGVTVPQLLGREMPADGAGTLSVMVQPPGHATLRALDGRELSSPVLRDALDHGMSTVRLTRPEAAAVGLWERTAMAGLAHVDCGPLGTWGVVVASTAARMRDRQTRAAWRLALSIGLASGLVFAFGGLALRKQRLQLELARKLAVAEAVRARDAELQRAARMATMGTFAMGVAHEVSTPLGVIVGRTEQLGARLREDERGTRAVQVILEQANRIQQIVRRFLDLARGGAPSLGRSDPAEVARASARAVQHRFAGAGVSLVTDIPASMPSIQCDPALLEHAIVNLLLNACEACEQGGRVELAARAEGDRVAFVVTDDGVGISPENAARAAEPFFTTKSPGASGTGLGLAIASEIVKSHRGELSIAPEGARGTRARIEIPVIPVAREEQPLDDPR